MTNKQFSKKKFFKKCCELAQVEPTTRQASKFRRKIGSAYEQAECCRRAIVYNIQHAEAATA